MLLSRRLLTSFSRFLLASTDCTSTRTLAERTEIIQNMLKEKQPFLANGLDSLTILDTLEKDKGVINHDDMNTLLAAATNTDKIVNWLERARKEGKSRFSTPSSQEDIIYRHVKDWMLTDALLQLIDSKSPEKQVEFLRVVHKKEPELITQKDLEKVAGVPC